MKTKDVNNLIKAVTQFNTLPFCLQFSHMLTKYKTT